MRSLHVLLVLGAVLGMVLALNPRAYAGQPAVEIGLRATGAESGGSGQASTRGSGQAPAPAASPPVVDFGQVRAAQSPYVRPLAFQVSVTSSLPWSLSIKASQDLTDDSTGAVLPSSRIGWRRHGTGPDNWTALTRDDALVCNGVAGGNIPVPFDLRLDVLWSDPPGAYETEIVTTLAPSGALALAGASPNPFSPNGDGVNDTTVVSFEAPAAGTYAGDIFDMDGTKVTRFFGPAEGLATGWYTATWDGKDDAGDTVEDGRYAFTIQRIDESAQEVATCAGILVVDTVAPPLEIDSPLLPGEVGPSVTLSGTTEPEIRVHVRLNGTPIVSITADGSGAFSADIDVPPGANELEVIAEDHAGNRTQQTLELVNNSEILILSPSGDTSSRSRLVGVAGRGPTSSPVTVHVNGRARGEGRSDAAGRWFIQGVTLEAGENTLVAEVVAPDGRRVRSLPVTVAYRPASAGTGRIAGTVKDALTRLPLEGAHVVLVPADGSGADPVEPAEVVTDAEGAYALEGVPAGTYQLRASLVNYATRVTPPFELADGESIDDMDIELERNVALQLKKAADVSTIETGQYVTYTISVRNLLHEPVADVIVQDRLPVGMVAIPGTVRLNGAPFADPEADGGGVLTWEIGALEADGALTLSFKAAVGHDSPPGELVNTATASASTPCGAVSVGPAEAAVKVSKGIFTDNALVFGCVWLDADVDGLRGPDEPGVGGATIVLEDGTEVHADSGGAFSLPSVRPGLHVFKLRPESMPGGFKLAESDMAPIRIPERGTVRLDFRLIPANGANGYGNGNGNGNGLNSARTRQLHGMEDGLSLIGLAQAWAEASADGIGVEGDLALHLEAKLGDEAAVTAALDLARDGEGDGHDPAVAQEKHYEDYGDQSQLKELPFAGPLYVALDYRGLSAMYGRYSTGFMTGEFGRYPRTLPGALVQYSADGLFFAAFDALTEQVLARDEFPADGTGGPFYLEHLPIVRSSETVEVITRDRFDPERITASTLLARDVDYLIDYDRGRLVLTEPVPATDGSGNPRVVVVTYEFTPVGTDVSHHIMGARIDCQPYPGLSLGAQYLRHAQEPDPYTLTTLVGTYLPTSRVTLSGEYAMSWGERDPEPLGMSPAARGRAYVLRLDALPIDGIDVSARYSVVEPGFESPANGVEADTARLDLDTRVSLWPPLTLTASYSAARDNVLGDVSMPTTCERTYGVGAQYAFGPSAHASLAYTFRTTADDLDVHAVNERVNVLEASVARDFASGLTATAGASWMTEQDVISSDVTRTASRYVGASAQIGDDLHATATLSLETETAASSSSRTTLSLGLDWAPIPRLRARLSAELPIAGPVEDGTVMGLSVACEPLDTLRLSARYDTASSGARSLLVLSAAGRIAVAATLGARLSHERRATESDTWAVDASLAYRPVYSSRLALFGGFRMEDVRDAAADPDAPALERTISGRIEGAYRVADDLTVSARYVHRLLTERDGVDDLTLLTRAATIGAVKEIGDAWDVAGSYTLFLQDDVDARRQVYEVELGHRLAALAGARLALGVRRTDGALGSDATSDTRVYVGLGYAAAIGLP